MPCSRSTNEWPTSRYGEADAIALARVPVYSPIRMNRAKCRNGRLSVAICWLHEHQIRRGMGRTGRRVPQTQTEGLRGNLCRFGKAPQKARPEGNGSLHNE